MSAHMQRLQRSLTASVSAYNDAVGSLESRVLVSARRFPALGVVGVETEEIADLPPVEASPRLLQAMELVADVDEATPSAQPRGRRVTPPPVVTALAPQAAATPERSSADLRA